MTRFLMLVVLVGALASGCTGVAPVSQPAATSPLTQTETEAEPITGTEIVTDTDAVTPETPEPDWLADAETYRDETVGFELRYPAGWDLLDVSDETRQNPLGYAVTLNSWPRQEEGRGGIPEGGTKLDIQVQPMAPASPADAAATRRDQLAQDPANPTISNEREVRLGVGLPATRWEVEGPMGRTVEFVTATNGYSVVFSGMGDFELVEEIVRTMQPFQ